MKEEPEPNLKIILFFIICYLVVVNLESFILTSIFLIKSLLAYLFIKEFYTTLFIYLFMIISSLNLLLLFRYCKKKTFFSICKHSNSYVFTFSSWMRRYWFYVKNDFRNFHQIFTFWDRLSQKKRFLRKCLSVCLSVCRSCAA